MALLKAESYKQGAIRSTLFNVAAKGLGFLNSLLIVYLFGTGAQTDIYFIIISSALIVTSFINGVDQYVLLPEAMRLRMSESSEKEKQFLNFFIWLYLGLGALLAIVTGFTPVLYYSLFSKLDAGTLGSQHTMLVISALVAPLQLVTNLMVSVLASHRYFTVPMLVSLINSIISIVVLSLLGHSLSIVAAAVGLVTGYLVNLVWLFIYFKRRLQWNFFEPLHRPSKKVVRHILLVQSNILPVCIRNFSATFFVSGLGVGVLSALNYGQQLAFLPEVLIISQLVAVSAIKFNEMSASRDEAALNDFFSRLLKLLFIIILPVAAIMAITSADIVATIFAFARKVDESSRENIAQVIFFLALTLPFRGLDLTMTRLVMSLQKVKEVVVYGIILHVLITILVIAGVTTYGLNGYLLAIVAGYNVLMPFLYYMLLKRVAPQIQYAAAFRNSSVFILFNVLLVPVFLYARNAWMVNVNPWAVMVIIPGLYVACIVVFNRVTNYFAPLNILISNLTSRK